MNKNNGVPKIAGWSSWLARESHNLEVDSSSLSPATMIARKGVRAVLIRAPNYLDCARYLSQVRGLRS